MKKPSFSQTKYNSTVRSEKPKKIPAANHTAKVFPKFSPKNTAATPNSVLSKTIMANTLDNFNPANFGITMGPFNFQDSIMNTTTQTQSKF